MSRTPLEQSGTEDGTADEPVSPTAAPESSSSAPAVADRPERGSGGARSSWARRLAVFVIALGAMAAGCAWSLASPVASSPDDDYHLTSIWCAASYDTKDCKQTGTFKPGWPIVTVPALLSAGACYAGNSEQSAVCQEEVIARGRIESVRVNTVDYPPGYYRVMNVFVGDDVERSVVAMRVFNVFLAVALFTVLAVSGTRTTRRLQLYALGASLIPMGWFIIASLNPSGWAVTGVTAFGFGLHSALLVRKRAKFWANVGVAVVGALMAMNSRGDAAIYVGIVALGVSVLHWRRLRANKWLLVLPLVLAVAAVTMALSAAQVAGIATPDPVTPRTRIDVALNLVVGLPLLFSGLFGYGWGLGWLDTYVPPVTAFSMCLVFGFFILSGLARSSRTKLLALAVIGGALVAIPAVTIYRSRLVAGEGLQPRYLLPLIPIFLVLVMTGRREGKGLRLTRIQASVIWVMLTLANAGALHADIRRYITGTDGPFVLGDAEWWWHGAPSPALTWLIGSLGFAVFAAAIIVTSGGRAPQQPGSDAGPRFSRAGT